MTIKNICLSLIIISTFLGCWLPPYDAEMSNTVHLLGKMNFVGELNYMDQLNIDYGIGDYQILSEKWGLKCYGPNSSNRAFFLYETNNYEGSADGGGGMTVQALRNHNGTFSRDGNPYYFEEVSSNDNNMNWIFSSDDSIEGSNPVGLEAAFYDYPSQSIRLQTYKYDSLGEVVNSNTLQNIPGDSDPRIMRLIALYRYGGNLENNDYIIFTERENNPDYYFEIQRIEDGIPLSGTIRIRNYFGNGTYRILYNPNSKMVILSLINDKDGSLVVESFMFSLGDSTNLDFTSTGITENPDNPLDYLSDYRINDLSEKDFPLVAMDDGSFLFYRIESYDSSVFTLWNDSGTVKILPTGKMSLSDHFWVNDVHTLAFTYYYEKYSHGDETRSMMLYTCKDSDFRAIFP